MDEAASYVAPTCAAIESLAAPMGVAAATDDPVHPAEVAFEWVSAAPRRAVDGRRLGVRRERLRGRGRPPSA